MSNADKNDKNIKILIAQNNKARFDYFIDDVYEAGIILTGSEVKSLRKNKASIGESHAACEDNNIFIYNLHIPEYTEANRLNHYPKRPRKLLLHRKEIKRLIGLVQRKGITLVPLKMFFNYKNLVKVSLAVATGKKQHDKRQSIKERDWTRAKARVMREQD